MIHIRTLALGASLAAFSVFPAFAFDGVVASIKPVHSLVAGVMKGVGEPSLIVRGSASPHTYSLRPSDAKALESAKLVFWVGPGMEAFLDGAIDALGKDANVVTLSEAPGLMTLRLREGGTFEPHDDGDEGEEHHHHDETFDQHLWLDPENASAMVDAIEAALTKADPADASAYKKNAEALRIRLDQLESEMAARLQPVKDKSFIAFHDAYQYFENRFSVRAAGSITVSPEVTPGVARLKDIQAKIAELGATCVFAEPQFEPSLITMLTEGTGAQSGTLDPEGATYDPGPDLYFDMMHGIAASLRDCLE